MSSLYQQPVAFASRSVVKIDLCARKTRIAAAQTKAPCSRLPKSTTQTSLQNGQRPRYASEAEERTPSLLIVRRAEQRLALAQKLLRRRAPRVVAIQSRSVDRHAPTCAVQADLDP